MISLSKDKNCVYYRIDGLKIDTAFGAGLHSLALLRHLVTDIDSAVAIYAT